MPEMTNETMLLLATERVADGLQALVAELRKARARAHRDGAGSGKAGATARTEGGRWAELCPSWGVPYGGALLVYADGHVESEWLT